MEKRYDFQKAEESMQELWKKEQIYKFDSSKKGEIYSIDTPPPTVSGSLHIGHIFSYTQAEMIARYRRMQGFNVFYPFGFDDNGLPTERLVEREEHIIAKSMPRNEFIKKCMNTTEKYESEFKNMWKTLGFSVDWSLQYSTVSEEVRKISQELFIELAKKGKAYPKKSPVLWCTECQTSIAQAELETKELATTFNYIPFLCDGDTIEVATTRPELLYGCVCLFVNPDDDRYSKYIGKMATVPLYNFDIPIMSDEAVSIEKGTGAVMCATFGDSTDAEWVEKYNLPYKEIITKNGYINADVPYIGGLRITKARAVIIETLKESNLVLKSEEITHTIATHERCGTPIEIIPSRQWYIDVLSHKDRYLKAADEINWYPESMKARYIAWVENLKWDWCISRQRYFGIPFPVWYCAECGKATFADTESLPINPLETEYTGTCDCGCNKFTPESAVLDTWATSSITPQINERFGLPLVPMSMRAQAHEIIRTWTFYTIVRSLYHTSELPWKDIMISGFVLAKKGEKISKSKSNASFEPNNLIQTHSADAIRYWAANANLGTDTFFSPDDLKISKRLITKLWNVSKFAISHLQDIEFPIFTKLLPIDKWIIAKTDETILKATQLLNNYEIGHARHAIDDFFWNDFCDDYIEIVKERLYKPEIHGYAERKSGQYALYYAMINILKMYAIYVPHITEYIYQNFFKTYEDKKSIHLMQWNKPKMPNEEILLFGEIIKTTVSKMRKYKSENNLSMKTEMDYIEINGDEKFLPFFKKTEKDLIACSNAKEIKYVM